MSLDDSCDGAYPWLDFDINVDSLRYFLAAVELGSFQAAADYLHVTPQAVGKAIARLEDRLGSLIKRDKRLRGLTPRGRVLVTEATKIVSSLAELASKVAPSKKQGPAGPVAVGATASVAQYIMPGVCAQVKERFPKVQPHILALAFPEMEEQLLAGRLDFGVSAVAPNRPGLEGEAGPNIASVIVAADGEPGEWSDFEYIVPRLPVGANRPIDGWPARGYPRRISAETNQLEVALRLAEAGMGATVTPLVAVHERLEVGTLKIVARPPVEILHQLWISWRAGVERTSAAVVLAEALQDWQNTAKQMLEFSR